MTDYAQEQQDELEALSSILMDDLQEVTDSIPLGWTPVGKVHRVIIQPQQDEGQEMEYPLKVELVFAHTPSYPDDPPLLKARGLQGISDADVGVLQQVLEDAVEANLGMAMVYTLITTAQEWVQDKAASMAVPSHDPEAELKRQREAEEARLAALRAHGQPVNPEAFSAWKARFDAEMALEKAKMEDGKLEERRNKLTGKQWFQQQEAQHLEIEEPDLEPDEEDGEGWDGEEDGEDDEDHVDDDDEDEDEEDSDDEELLDELLASKAG